MSAIHSGLNGPKKKVSTGKLDSNGSESSDRESLSDMLIVE